MTTTTFDTDDDQDETVAVDDQDSHEEATDDATEAGGDLPEETESPAEANSGSRGGKRPASARRGQSSKLTKKQVQSVLQTRELVVASTDEAREIAATLLGVDEAADIDGLTVAAVTAERSANRAVDSLIAVAGTEEQLDRVIAVSSWTRPTAASAWRLLHEFGLVSRQLPSNEAKAAAAIAKAADELPEALAEVRGLLR